MNLIFFLYINLLFSPYIFPSLNESNECTLNSTFSSDGRKCLHIAGIFPMEGGWAGGNGCFPSFLLALNDINKDPNILPDHYIKLHYNDSKCLPGLGTRIMYDLLYTKPTKIVLFVGCSAVTTSVGEAAKMWNMIVITYGASNPALSNKKRFPTLMRIHPPQTIHNPTRIRLFKMWNWKKIAILQELQELFTETALDLQTKLFENGMELTVRQSFYNDPSNAIKILKKQDARIIVGLFYDNFARKVACEAFKNGLYGKKYVWLLLGWYADDWIEKKEGQPEDEVNCTREQLVQAMESHITIESLMINQDESVSTSGMTASDFTKRLDAYFLKKGQNPQTITGYAEAPLAYDALWAVALTFNDSLSELKQQNLKLEDFDYNNKDILNTIQRKFQAINFRGISGHISFTSSGDRISWTKIEQMQNGVYKFLGFYNVMGDNLTWVHAEKWIDGVVPLDSTPVQYYMKRLNFAVLVSIFFISSLCIFFAMLAILIFITFRNHSCISNSFPVINQVFFIGVIILNVFVFLNAFNSNYEKVELFDSICKIKPWLFSFGFTLAYGAFFYKIFKAYQILFSLKNYKESSTHSMFQLQTFANAKFKLIPSSNTFAVDLHVNRIGSLEPAIALICFLFVDFCLILAWQFRDTLHRVLKSYPAIFKKLPDGKEFFLVPQSEYCDCNHYFFWLGIFFSYKGVFMLLASFLTYECRNLKIRQINDLKFVKLSIINIGVLAALGVLIHLLIEDNKIISILFLSLIIILATSVSLALILVPKIIFLWRNSTSNEDSKTDNMTSEEMEQEEKYYSVIAEIAQLDKLLVKKKKRIKQLLKLLEDKERKNISVS